MFCYDSWYPAFAPPFLICLRVTVRFFPIPFLFTVFRHFLQFPCAESVRIVRLYNRCHPLSIKPTPLKANRFAFVSFTILLLFNRWFQPIFCGFLPTFHAPDRVAFFERRAEAYPCRTALLLSRRSRFGRRERREGRRRRTQPLQFALFIADREAGNHRTSDRGREKSGPVMSIRSPSKVWQREIIWSIRGVETPYSRPRRLTGRKP